MNYMDMISRLGVSSAHPGGFRATQRLLEKALAPGGLNILEVGCGTGRTTCHLARLGYRVTALDRHPLMLEKARNRADQEGLDGIEWVSGDVHALPFEDDSFDLILAESVTVFTDIPVALREYRRVLKPGGRLVDREIVLHAGMPEDKYEELTAYFGIEKVLSVDEWLTHFELAGFLCPRPESDAFRNEEGVTDDEQIRELDLGVLFDPEIGMGILKYADLMLSQETYFRACDFIAWKPEDI